MNINQLCRNVGPAVAGSAGPVPPPLKCKCFFLCTEAHAATDVTGFGILGHASNLAQTQTAPVSFKIHTLPSE